MIINDKLNKIFFYQGDEFPDWNGDAFLGGLKGRALVRIEFKNDLPVEAERFSWSQRVRDVELGSDGAIWALEDGRSGRLIKFIKAHE